MIWTILNAAAEALAQLDRKVLDRGGKNQEQTGLTYSRLLEDIVMGMGKTFTVLTMILIFALSGQLQLQGQTVNVKTDPAFNAFWIKFKAAVARNDKGGVADMTKLPFMLDSRDLDRAGFIKQYSSLFTPKVRRCFARAKPIRDQDALEIFCGEQIFLFAKVDGVYKFTEIGVND